MRRLFKCWPHFTPRCCVHCALQKQSHTKNAEQPPNAQVAPMSRSSWWGGFAGVVIGAVIDFAAMGFGRTYLVCAVGGGAALVANVVVAKYWAMEELMPCDMRGCGIVVVGAGICASTATAAKSYTVPQLQLKFGSTEFLAAAVVTAGACAT